MEVILHDAIKCEIEMANKVNNDLISFEVKNLFCFFFVGFKLDKEGTLVKGSKYFWELPLEDRIILSKAAAEMLANQTESKV